MTDERADEKALHLGKGTSAPWYSGWVLSDEARDRFRRIAKKSRERKLRAEAGEGPAPVHEINEPLLVPMKLMPQLPGNGLRALSLFSGGGGLDLGYARAGFTHVASYDVQETTGSTLRAVWPHWRVYSGEAGDVTTVDWSQYLGAVDVIHGGPPCQPFSNSGKQGGAGDARDMVPEFVRAVLEAKPAAFMLENVPGLTSARFTQYLRQTFYAPLEDAYEIVTFQRTADEFGLPQTRKRVFFVGFADADVAVQFRPPEPTHESSRFRKKKPNHVKTLPLTPGVREALGLPSIGYDALSPTIRSGLTGPRNSTSILNGSSAQKAWARLCIWPNGVARTREAARAFVPENEHFRLAVPDVAVIQGFPQHWPLPKAVYRALGQIGNAVAPPVGYRIAAAIAASLLRPKVRAEPCSASEA